ncbi:MAG: phycobiliprotein lyase [Cyanophyceae cyanobacterium]
MDLSAFHHFFECCVGDWQTERTYHYLMAAEVERSHTEFQIQPIDLVQKAKVLVDNRIDDCNALEVLPGYHLEFQTVSEKGEQVAHGLNFLFVPDREEGPVVVGRYLRDRAYEESRAMVSQFRFDRQSRELLMTTTYSQVVSVDSITLVNPKLRVRRILNYLRPAAANGPLDTLQLAGFGIEQKVA